MADNKPQQHRHTQNAFGKLHRTGYRNTRSPWWFEWIMYRWLCVWRPEDLKYPWERQNQMLSSFISHGRTRPYFGGHNMQGSSRGNQDASCIADLEAEHLCKRRHYIVEANRTNYFHGVTSVIRQSRLVHIVCITRNFMVRRVSCLGSRTVLIFSLFIVISTNTSLNAMSTFGQLQQRVISLDSLGRLSDKTARLLSLCQRHSLSQCRCWGL